MSETRPDVIVEIALDGDLDFEVSISELVEGEYIPLVIELSEKGTSAAPVAANALARLEAAAAEARRQLEAAGLVAKRGDGWVSYPRSPVRCEGILPADDTRWETRCWEYAQRLDDIAQRLGRRPGESVEALAARVAAEAIDGAIHRAHRAHGEATIATYRKLRHTGETDEACVARLTQVRDLEIRAEGAEARADAFADAIGPWAGTGAREAATPGRHIVTETRRSAYGVGGVVQIEYERPTAGSKAGS